jgi:uncharacterized repeat protein (TIGR01451 family)
MLTRNLFSPSRRVALQGALLAFAGAAAFLTASQAHAAAYATGGNGKYRNEILWLTWGGGDNGTDNVTLANNAQSTATLQVASGEQLIVTCTMSAITGTVHSYRPGNYSGDALDDLYYIGGTGGSNQLITGLSTVNNASNSFTVTCTATLNGSPYTIPGLVIADAESLNTGGTLAAPSESISGTASGSWDIVEMFRVAGANYYATKTAGTGTQTMRFGPGGQGGGTSPAAVSFLTFNSGAYAGASRQVAMNFAMKGGGVTAMAIGLQVPRADFGDAPGYTAAAHLFYDWVHGADGGVSDAGTNINDSAFSVGGLSPLTTDHLGTIGPDGEASTSSNDNSDGIGGANEEDAWPSGATLSVLAASTTFAQSVSCVGNGTVAGWIDFDINGTFDNDERAAATCTSGSAALSWTVPTDIKAGTTYVRLRYATNASQLASASGTATTGEVEDTAITIQPQPAFATCPSSLLIAQSPNNGNSTLSSITTTGNPFTFTTLGTATSNYNAIGFNQRDGYLYGIAGAPTGSKNQLVRVGSNGSAANLGVVEDLPLPRDTYYSGEIDNNGNYYVLDRNTATLYRIDLKTTPYKAVAVTLSRQIDSIDMGWINGLLYSVTPSSAATASGAKGQLYSINPGTGTVTNLGTQGDAARQYGSMFATPNGLYGNDNSGGFYQIDLKTGASTRLSTSPGATLNDGAHCVDASISLPANIGVTKSDGTDIYVPETNAVYTIVVSNTGTFGTAGIKVVDPVPTGIATLTWTCAATAGSACTGSGSGPIDDSVGLAVGGSVTYTATVAVPRDYTGSLVNSVTITTSGDYTNQNTTVTATDTDTQATANLNVSKSNGTTASNLGSDTTYTIVVSNGGPSAANGAHVLDPVVAGLSCTAVTCSAAGGAACPTETGAALLSALQSTSSNGVVIPTLPNAGSVTFAVTCKFN